MSHETAPPSLASPPLDTDSGRRWRRVALIGAALCTLATLLPFGNAAGYVCMWGAVDGIFELITGYQSSRSTGNPFFDSLVLLFCCFAPSVLTVGPLCLLAGLGTTEVRWARRMRLAVGIFMSLASVLPPAAAGFILLKRSPQWNISVMAATLSGFLLLGALLFLSGWDRRSAATGPFWMGLLAVASSFVAWLCLTAAWTIKGPDMELAWIAPSGLAGSALLLVGWLKWWRAVALDLRRREAETASRAAPFL